MKTVEMEMNLSEMEQVTGGGAVHRAAKRKLRKLIFGGISSLFGDGDDVNVQGPNIGTGCLNNHLSAGET